MTVSTAKIATFAAALWLAGCATGPAGPAPSLWRPTPGLAPNRLAKPVAEARPAIVPVGHRELPPAEPNALPAVLHPLDGVSTLTADDVVRVVLERNPTLEQMRATVAA